MSLMTHLKTEINSNKIITFKSSSVIYRVGKSASPALGLHAF